MSDSKRMLQCNMNPSTPLQLDLEDLLADLHHARRGGDLGRLALLCYCEVRRWARHAWEPELAERAARMITATPHASRKTFLADVDALIEGLEQAQHRFATGASGAAAPRRPASSPSTPH
jgi:hypothetical protein